MNVTIRRLADLKPDPGNARTHDERNIDAIKQSLERFGQVEPLIHNVRSGLLVGGHGRMTAMLSMGWTEAKVVDVDLDQAAAAALGLALNRSAELAGWDEEALRAAIAMADGAAIGWSEEELAGMLAEQNVGGGECDPDEVPEVPAEPITRRGDLWVLGDHRLLCGDSTNAQDISRVLAGRRANCVFTDPPYGVSVGAKNRLLNSFQKSGRNLSDIADDDLTPTELEAALLPAFKLVREVMADDCTVFLTAPQGGELGMMMMMMMMQKAGLKVRHVLIWKKNAPTFSMGRLDYDYQHEPILMTWGKRHKRPMLGTFKTSVWEVDKPRACADHPTMKPVELYTNAYLNNSDRGDLVFDPYSGSGPAFIAAEMTGRTCTGVEIEPKYCDVIVRRWETFTGKKAVRQDQNGEDLGVAVWTVQPSKPVR